jgi:drug/metabolite transporter (DMT)-like permease
MPPRARRAPALLLALAALLWAGNFVLARAVHAHVPPVALAFWRWTVALLVLLPLSWRELRAVAPALRASWRILLPLGILGVGNFNLLVYVGLGTTTATNAVLLNSACPAFIFAIGPALGARRATGRQLAGVVVSLAGVLAIVARGDPGTLRHLAFARGDLWVLAAVVSWALYTVLLARRPAGIPPLALLTALVAVGVVWIAPFYAWELARGLRLTWDGVTAGTIAYVAVMASVVAYFAWNQGVAALGAARAGPFLHLMPAFGAILAAALLGEAFRPFHLAGIALILAGVAVAGRG